jgi:hypothetical protein
VVGHRIAEYGAEFTRILQFGLSVFLFVGRIVYLCAPDGFAVAFLLVLVAFLEEIPVDVALHRVACRRVEAGGRLFGYVLGIVEVGILVFARAEASGYQAVRPA